MEMMSMGTDGAKMGMEIDEKRSCSSRMRQMSAQG
jgi:hypothetical protein